MAGFPEIEENQEWFYLDSTGQEFGPFPSDTMRDWFQQGHFPIGEELMVRLPTWKNHVPLRMIYADMGDAFRSTARRSNHRMQQPEDNRAVAAAPQQQPQQQQFAGYCMVPPTPCPYPDLPVMAQPDFGAFGGMSYGFPAAAPMPGGGGLMRPGGCGDPGVPPPRQQGGYGLQPSLPQGGGGAGRFEGRIKSFNAKQGFGFIECPEAYRIYGRDVFLHKAQIGDLKVGTQVTCTVEMNKQGMPQARELCTLDGLVPGPFPEFAGGPGSKGGNKSFGKGSDFGDRGGKKGGKGGGKRAGMAVGSGGMQPGRRERMDGGFGGRGMGFPAGNGNQAGGEKMMQMHPQFGN